MNETINMNAVLLLGSMRHCSPTTGKNPSLHRMAGETMGTQASQSLLMGICKGMALLEGKSANYHGEMHFPLIQKPCFWVSIPQIHLHQEELGTADGKEAPNKRGPVESVMAPAHRGMLYSCQSRDDLQVLTQGALGDLNMER